MARRIRIQSHNSIPLARFHTEIEVAITLSLTPAIQLLTTSSLVPHVERPVGRGLA